MTSRWRKAGIVAVAVIGALGVAGWVITHPVIRDPYRFLGGRRADHQGVIGPGSWSAKQIRTYSWRQPWREVAAAARTELPTYGMTEQPNRDKNFQGAVWLGEMIDGGPCGIGSDTMLEIAPGKAKSLTFAGDPTDNNPDWVTVAISTDLDDNWINIIRYTFFPIPDK